MSSSETSLGVLSIVIVYVCSACFSPTSFIGPMMSRLLSVVIAT